MDSRRRKSLVNDLDKGRSVGIKHVLKNLDNVRAGFASIYDSNYITGINYMSRKETDKRDSK